MRNKHLLLATVARGYPLLLECTPISFEGFFLTRPLPIFRLGACSVLGIPVASFLLGIFGKKDDSAWVGIEFASNGRGPTFFGEVHELSPHGPSFLLTVGRTIQFAHFGFLCRVSFLVPLLLLKGVHERGRILQVAAPRAGHGRHGVEVRAALVASPIRILAPVPPDTIAQVDSVLRLPKDLGIC